MPFLRRSFRFSLTLVFAVCLAGPFLRPARADVLSLNWANVAGSYQSGAAAAGTPQSFTIGGNTVSTVFSDDTTHFYENNSANPTVTTPTVSTYGTSAPNSVYYANGGMTGYEALQIGADFSDNTTQDIKFTINFSHAVYGVAFTIFDIDAGNVSGPYVDQIRNILGVNGADTVLPALSAVSTGATMAVYPGNGITSSDPTILNAATGFSSNAQTSNGGNLNVAFSTQTPVTSVSFIWSDNQKLSGDGLTTAPADSGLQIIALGNISWGTEAGAPEPGTFVTTGLSLAGMAAVVLRRRHRP